MVRASSKPGQRALLSNLTIDTDVLSAGVTLRCSMLIELVQSTLDYSYGAVCHLTIGRERRTVMVCDDTMVGKFTLKSSGFAVDRSELASFTKANCPGGG